MRLNICSIIIQVSLKCYSSLSLTSPTNYLVFVCQLNWFYIMLIKWAFYLLVNSSVDLHYAEISKIGDVTSPIIDISAEWCGTDFWRATKLNHRPYKPGSFHFFLQFCLPNNCFVTLFNNLGLYILSAFG